LSAKRPRRRKNRANPETGSVISGLSNGENNNSNHGHDGGDNDDDASVSLSMSGISIGSTMSNNSVLSGIF
jgi:hypothetical protein